MLGYTFVLLTFLTGILAHDIEEVASKIRGIPGVDYPVYHDIPRTSFRCADQEYNPGFYADPEASCQVFHFCYKTRQESFLCPTGTVFNQAALSCDYWYNFNCSLAPSFYDVNANSVLKDAGKNLPVIVNIDNSSPASLDPENSQESLFEKMAPLYDEDKVKKYLGDSTEDYEVFEASLNSEKGPIYSVTELNDARFQFGELTTSDGSDMETEYVEDGISPRENIEDTVGSSFEEFPFQFDGTNFSPEFSSYMGGEQQLTEIDASVENEREPSVYRQSVEQNNFEKLQELPFQTDMGKSSEKEQFLESSVEYQDENRNSYLGSFPAYTSESYDSVKDKSSEFSKRESEAEVKKSRRKPLYMILEPETSSQMPAVKKRHKKYFSFAGPPQGDSGDSLQRFEEEPDEVAEEQDSSRASQDSYEDAEMEMEQNAQEGFKMDRTERGPSTDKESSINEIGEAELTEFERFADKVKVDPLAEVAQTSEELELSTTDPTESALTEDVTTEYSNADEVDDVIMDEFSKIMDEMKDNPSPEAAEALKEMEELSKEENNRLVSIKLRAPAGKSMRSVESNDEIDDIVLDEFEKMMEEMKNDASPEVSEALKEMRELSRENDSVTTDSELKEETNEESSADEVDEIILDEFEKMMEEMKNDPSPEVAEALKEMQELASEDNLVSTESGLKNELNKESNPDEVDGLVEDFQKIMDETKDDNHEVKAAMKEMAPEETKQREAANETVTGLAPDFHEHSESMKESEEYPPHSSPYEQYEYYANYPRENAFEIYSDTNSEDESRFYGYENSNVEFDGYGIRNARGLPDETWDYTPVGYNIAKMNDGLDPAYIEQLKYLNQGESPDQYFTPQTYYNAAGQTFKNLEASNTHLKPENLPSGSVQGSAYAKPAYGYNFQETDSTQKYKMPGNVFSPVHFSPKEQYSYAQRPFSQMPSHMPQGFQNAKYQMPSVKDASYSLPGDVKENYGGSPESSFPDIAQESFETASQDDYIVSTTYGTDFTTPVSETTMESISSTQQASAWDETFSTRISLDNSESPVDFTYEARNVLRDLETKDQHYEINRESNDQYEIEVSSVDSTATETEMEDLDESYFNEEGTIQTEENVDESAYSTYDGTEVPVNKEQLSRYAFEQLSGSPEVVFLKDEPAADFYEGSELNEPDESPNITDEARQDFKSSEFYEELSDASYLKDTASEEPSANREEIRPSEDRSASQGFYQGASQEDSGKVWNFNADYINAEVNENTEEKPERESSNVENVDAPIGSKQGRDVDSGIPVIPTPASVKGSKSPKASAAKSVPKHPGQLSAPIRLPNEAELINKLLFGRSQDHGAFNFAKGQSPFQQYSRPQAFPDLAYDPKFNPASTQYSERTGKFGKSKFSVIPRRILSLKKDKLSLLQQYMKSMRERS